MDYLLRLHLIAATDWDQVTALATVVLAGAAILAAGLAGLGLRTAARDLATSREQLEGSRRPVVVPSPENHPVVREGQAILAVPIENIGSGAALDVWARAVPLNDAGDPPGHGGACEPIGVQVVGASASKLLLLRAHGWAQGACFALAVHYRDVSGAAWVTTARFFGDPPIYHNIGPMPAAGDGQRSGRTQSAHGPEHTRGAT